MCNINQYHINKSNLINNLLEIRKTIGDSVKLCAVVKANAYGLGVKNVCPIMDDYVDFYAVVSAMEALELRKISPNKPILILGSSDLNYANECAQNDISISISSLSEVKYLNENLNSVIKIHLKINTGMNRYGIDSFGDLRAILDEIKSGGKIVIEGVYTHFATKSSDQKFIDLQYEKFAKFIDFLSVKNLIIHCASSYVSLTDSQKRCNMVRVGFAMYGATDYHPHLKNVVSILGKVMFLHDIKSGETVGYDRTYQAKRKTKIAVCSLGYADGFARNLGNNFKVLINGRFARVVGRVCMDCFMADVTHIPDVSVGSRVTVLGCDGGKKIDLNMIAKAISFSPYEVLLNFRQRRMDVVVEE